MTARGFNVALADYGRDADALHGVRTVVFVDEQQVPAALERDASDAAGWHVLARSADGTPVGAGRLTPHGTLGRMAVLRDWRGRGVGDALLLALVQQARALGWAQVRLNAQAGALDFYVRHGFVPTGPRFIEAGIDHQAMHRLLDAPTPIDTRDAALAATIAVVRGGRRQLRLYSRDLDPGLLDRAEAMAALRRWATGGGATQVLLHDVAAPQRALPPLIGLAQRLSSSFEFRVIEEPVDRAYVAAFAVNDTGGWFHRPLGHRFDGETRVDGAARGRQLHAVFEPAWERARPVTEFRALGI